MEMSMTEKLPDGVHRLSDESVAILKRAAERGAKAIEKHSKRES